MVINNLSGGNQQKVVIAKGLATHPRMVAELAGQGVPIILISSELQEVLAPSDRVLVMHGGRVKAILDRADASQETVMSAALLESEREVAV